MRHVLRGGVYLLCCLCNFLLFSGMFRGALHTRLAAEQAPVQMAFALGYMRLLLGKAGELQVGCLTGKGVLSVPSYHDIMQPLKKNSSLLNSCSVPPLHLETWVAQGHVMLSAIKVSCPAGCCKFGYTLICLILWSILCPGSIHTLGKWALAFGTL